MKEVDVYKYLHIIFNKSLTKSNNFSILTYVINKTTQEVTI